MGAVEAVPGTVGTAERLVVTVASSVAVAVDVAELQLSPWTRSRLSLGSWMRLWM